MFYDLLKQQKEAVSPVKKEKNFSSLQDQLKKTTFTKVVSVYLDGCVCGFQCGHVWEVEITVPEDSEIEDGMFLTGKDTKKLKEGKSTGIVSKVKVKERIDKDNGGETIMRNAKKFKF